MEIKENSSFELLHDGLSIVSPEAEDRGQGSPLLYVDYPPLRMHARQVANTLVELYGDRLFQNICGRCGKCCHDMPVPVSAGEIWDIAHHLSSQDDLAFRRSYIETAMTWDEADGYIKKIERHCSFLKLETSGIYSCRIYPVRPGFCRDMQPMMNICLKDRGKLIDHVEKIFLQQDAMAVTTREGVSLTMPFEPSDPHSPYNELKNLILTLPAPDKSQADLINETHKTLENLRRDVLRAGFTLESGRKIIEISGFLENLRGKSLRNEKLIDILKEKAGRLLELKRVPPEAPGHCGRDDEIDRLSLFPSYMTVIRKRGGLSVTDSIPYRESNEILKNVRELVSRVTSFSDPLLWEILWHTELHCLLCGECCRNFRVEISPYDIERLADYFGISMGEARARYVYPPIFSCNEADGILAKKCGTRLDQKMSASECIFLEEQSSGVSTCGIYPIRPEVCRRYSPTDTLCLEVSVKKHRDGFIQNIVCIEIRKGLLEVYSRISLMKSTPPFAMHLGEDPELQKKYRALEDSILNKLLP